MEYKLKSLDDAKVFDLLNEMVYIADAVTQEILFVNAALRQRIGLAGGDLSGLTCYKLMHGLDAPCAKCKTEGLVPGAVQSARVYNVMAKCDVYVKTRIITVGARLMSLVISLDITRVEKEKKQLGAALAVQEMVSESLHILNEISDLDQAYMLMLQNLGETLRATRSYLYFLKKGLFYNTHEWCAAGIASQKANRQEMSPQLLSRWMEIFRDNRCVTVEDVTAIRRLDMVEHRIMSAQGARSYIVAPIRMRGHVVGALGVDNPPPELVRNIEPLLLSIAYHISARMTMREHTALLETMSFHDAMTHCGNRNAFMRRKDMLDRSTSRHPIGVIYFDLNRLKETNDTLGHEYGDRLIRKAAELMHRVFPPEEIFRVGGDEFVALCADRSEAYVADAVASVRTALKKDRTISISIGSAWDEGPSDIQALIDRADHAMYEEKERYHQRAKKAK